MRFRSTRRGIEASFAEPEAVVLRQCVTDLLELLGPAQEPDEDPLAALVGLSGGPVDPPEDPVLQRLLPDAYGADDGEASREFRRFTEGDLRAGKRASARVLLETLPEGEGQVRLDRAQADAWLGTLNDVRLALGTRLEVTEELNVDALPEDDPRVPALHVYTWLGWVQESLLGALLPRR